MMNQLCKVCAEPAAGFHFGAFTCEGCKSFFGRTYNNLSQIHECKNGRQCVINKQNRTSCKACRLRKCLEVGMSKTGSRYGRRSNWFKIHCILQEQCAYGNETSQNSPGQPFRTPVTPTLQDGSLPFVNSHLRDALHSIDPHQSQSDLIGRQHLPISSTSSRDLTSNNSVAMEADSSNQIRASVAFTQLGTVEQRIQEETMNSLRRKSIDIEATYREQLLEVIRRSQRYQNLRMCEDSSTIGSHSRAISDSEQLSPLEPKVERIRRASDEAIERIRTNPCDFDWNKSMYGRTLCETSSVKSLSTSIPKVSSPVTVSLQTSHISTIKDIRSEANKIAISECSKPSSSSIPHSPSSLTPTSQNDGMTSQDEHETPMTEEERLSFLKSASKISTNSVLNSNDLQNHFLNISNLLPRHRGLPQENILFTNSNRKTDVPLYSPVNNNMFPFPTYPPVWNSLVPFHTLSKFYPPVNTSLPPLPPLTIDMMKNSMFLPPGLSSPIMNQPPGFSPENTASKKSIIDAILQVQRDNSPPLSTGTPVSSPDVTISLPQPMTSLVNSPPPTSSATGREQPIDLTVRRKRKMAKNEIVYKAGEDVMISEFERSDHLLRQEEFNKEQPSEIIVKGTSQIIDIKTTLECPTTLTQCPTTLTSQFQMPIKIMKLENPSDTLIA